MTSHTYQTDAPAPVPTGSVDRHGSAKTWADSGPALPHTGRPRTATATTTAEIDTAITHPGSVRINVKGAFIVDQGGSTPGASTPGNGQGSPTGQLHNGPHQTKDIRLPNHTAVVSHVAIDVCFAGARLPSSMLKIADKVSNRSAVPSPNWCTSREKRTRPSPAAGSTSSASRRTTYATV